jgi:hypothetical protein
LGILVYGPRAKQDNALIMLVARVFQLSKLIQIRDLGGAYNLNMLVTSLNRSYVMRAYRPWLLDERLAFLQHAKSIIQRSGIPVSLPLSRNGSCFIGTSLQTSLAKSHNG